MIVRATHRHPKALLTICAAWLLGCQPHHENENDNATGPDNTPGTPASVRVITADNAAITETTDAAKSRPALCDRPADDEVRDVFCADEPVAITSLRDLENKLGFSFDYEHYSMLNADGEYQSPTYAAVLSHSTALSGRLVSPINPRAIITSGTLFLTYNRGIQQVELAALDRNRVDVNLYLVRFEQACNTSAEGCNHGDLFTERVESDWLKVTLQDAEELKNSPSDCRQCHQRGIERPQLLMRELRGPWTHFFGGLEQSALPFDEPVGGELARDYMAAKDGEPYADIPAQVLTSTVGFTLQNSVQQAQPLIFDGNQILNERWPWTESTGYPSQALRSATWDASFEAFKRGEQLALPFYAPRATDPDKQRMLSESYRRYMAGELEAAALPDLEDIYPDDAQTRAEIGLQNVPDATPAELLVQACGTCHNDVLDQNISRARFNVAVQRLDRGELDSAMRRLEIERGAPGAMPPRDARQLDPAALIRLKDYLRAGQPTEEEQAFLDHASQAGMANPQIQGPALGDDENY